MTNEQIGAMLAEVPCPCTNCRKVAHVTYEERCRGRWTCYGCGAGNRYVRGSARVEASDLEKT